jgi:hypothetical protein
MQTLSPKRLKVTLGNQNIRIKRVSCQIYTENVVVFPVINCDPIQWPNNGYVRCDKSEFLYGSKCTVGCFEGNEMLSTTTTDPHRIMCDKSGDNKPTLDKAVPSCQGLLRQFHLSQILRRILLYCPISYHICPHILLYMYYPHILLYCPHILLYCPISHCIAPISYCIAIISYCIVPSLSSFEI